MNAVPVTYVSRLGYTLYNDFQAVLYHVIITIVCYPYGRPMWSLRWASGYLS